MTSLMTTLGLDRLTAAERMQLADELLDSLGDHTPELSPLTDAQRDDLDRRLEAFKDDPLAGSPYEEVMARLRGKR